MCKKKSLGVSFVCLVYDFHYFMVQTSPIFYANLQQTKRHDDGYSKLAFTMQASDANIIVLIQFDMHNFLGQHFVHHFGGVGPTAMAWMCCRGVAMCLDAARSM